MVNADSGYGTGQLPDKEGQMYHMQDDDLYMIPTAEVPLTNIFRDVVLSARTCPKNSADTPPASVVRPAATARTCEA